METTSLGFRVSLGSKLLQGGYIGDYIEEYYRGYGILGV